MRRDRARGDIERGRATEPPGPGGHRPDDHGGLTSRRDLVNGLPAGEGRRRGGKGSWKRMEELAEAPLPGH